MSHTLTADQRQRVARAHLSKIDTVILGGVYLADKGYKSSVDARLVHPYLREIRPSNVSLNHLPQRRDLQSIRQVLEVELSNEPAQDGLRVFEWLVSLLGPLEGQTIEWRQLALEEPRPLYPGETHDTTGELTRFFGVIDHVETVQQQSISLRCEIVLPEVTWAVADGPDTDPRDVGKRFPIPVGRAPRIPLINWQVGWITTLGEAISDTFTGDVRVLDASRFTQSGSFTLRIGTEDVTASYVTDTSINLSARAQGGTTAQVHFEGDQATELKDSIFVVGLDLLGVDRYYARNFQGNLVEFSQGTFTRENPNVIQGDLVSTLTLTEADMAILATILSQSLEAEADNPAEVFRNSAPNDGGTIVAAGLGRDGSDAVSVTEFNGTGSASDKDVIDHGWSSVSNGTDVVIEWRIKLATLDLTLTEPEFASSGILGGVVEAVGFPGGNPGSISAAAARPSSGTDTAQLTDLVGAWHAPTVATTINDLVSSGAELRLKTRTGAFEEIQVGDIVAFSGFALEIKVENPTPPAAQPALSTGFGLELYADVQGFIELPTREVVYPFEVGTGWFDLFGTHIESTDRVEGSFSQGLALGGVVIDTEDDATNWTTGAGSPVLSDVFEPIFDKNVVEIANGVATGSLSASRTFTPNTFDGGTLRVDFEFTGTYSQPERIALWFEWRDGSTVRRVEAYDFGTDWVVGEWYSIIINNDWGALDIDNLNVRFIKSGGGPTPGIGELSIRIHNMLAIATAGSQLARHDVDLDFSGSLGDSFELFIKGSPYDTLSVFLSSDAGGSGADPGSNFVDLTFDISDLSEAWTSHLNTAYNPTGSPNLSSIKRLIFNVDSLTATEGLFPLLATVGDDITGLLFDAFSKIVVTPTPYIASPGTPLKHPLDIARAWLENEGAEVDPDAWTEALARTDLTLEMAGDLRGQGYGWAEVLAAICFNGGVNVYPVFDTGVMRWALAVPDSADGGWREATPDGTLSAWDKGGVVSNYRDVSGELDTRWLGRYAIDLSQGVADDIYTQTLRADPSFSEIPTVPPFELAALEARIGHQNATPYNFDLLQDRATVQAVFGYYIGEIIREPRVFAVLGVPWFDAWALQLSDDVELTLPWSGETVRGRLLLLEKTPRTEQVQMRLLETVT